MFRSKLGNIPAMSTNARVKMASNTMIVDYVCVF